MKDTEMRLPSENQLRIYYAQSRCVQHTSVDDCVMIAMEVINTYCRPLLQKLEWQNKVNKEFDQIYNENLKKEQKESQLLRTCLDLAVEALDGLLKSEVIRTAEYITYSEAYLNALEASSKIKELQNKDSGRGDGV